MAIVEPQRKPVSLIETAERRGDFEGNNDHNV